MIKGVWILEIYDKINDHEQRIAQLLEAQYLCEFLEFLYDKETIANILSGDCEGDELNIIRCYVLGRGVLADDMRNWMDEG